MKNLNLVGTNSEPQEEVLFTCNNAAYSVGELALAFPNDFANYASEFAIRICDLFESGVQVIQNSL